VKCKNELYAIHKDGRKLYCPTPENVRRGIPVASITIDQDGHTFPEGSTWIRRADWSLQRGWSFAETGHPMLESPKTPAVFGIQAISRWSKKPPDDLLILKGYLYTKNANLAI